MSNFQYTDYNSTTLNNQRWYIISDTCAYPSITTILGHTITAEKKASLDNWQRFLGPEKAKEKTKHACDRGTAVHEMTEYHLKNIPIDFSKYRNEDVMVFNSLKLRLKNITSIYGQEISIYSDFLKVAGRCDLVGEWKNEQAIIDFKTSGKHKTEKDIYDYWLQCTFYAICHNELFNTDINKGVIIMGVENGMPLVFEKELGQFVEPLINRIDEFYKSL